VKLVLQAPTAVKSMQQEAMTTASSADSSAAAAVNAAAGLAPLNVSSELSQVNCRVLLLRTTAVNSCHGDQKHTAYLST